MAKTGAQTATPDATATVKGKLELAGDLTGSAATPTIKSSVSLSGSPTTTTQSQADNSTKIATTAYVDTAVLGQNFKEAVKYASTAALPTVVYSSGAGTLTGFAVGAISLDGSSPIVNDRVLIKNQVSTFQNGLYAVTATGSGIAVFVLTRTTDANTSAEFRTGDSVFVTAGSTLSSTTWAYTGIDSPNFTSDAITYAQVAGQGSFTGGNGITITGTSIAINTSITVDTTTAQTLTNKSLTTPKIASLYQDSVGGSNLLTMPATTDTLVGKATTDTLTNKTLTTPVLNGTPTGTGVATAATASTIALRDSSANLLVNNLTEGFTTTATAAGTTTLSITDTGIQVFTGSSTQTVKLPTTSVPAGGTYQFINLSSGAVTVQSSGANTIEVLAGGTFATFTSLVATPTTAANWSCSYVGIVITSGKELNISNTLTLAGTDGTTQTFQASDTIVGRATTDTLTNKRITPRVTTTNAPGGTPTTNTDNVDIQEFTGLAAAITSMTTNLSGTPTNGQLVQFSFVDNGTARAITWGTSFADGPAYALPTTTVVSTVLRVLVQYQTIASLNKYVCIGIA